jgi:TRAP-type mannitol/chloroaromatic compound transport system permease large subunit
MDSATIGQVLAATFFFAILGVLMFGYIVAWTLGGLAVIFALLGAQFGAFDLNLLNGLSTRFFGVITNPVLVAVPLFVFMGVVLERSKIAEALITTMGQLFGSLRGGLGISVVVVGAMLAASTGVVGATVVTMGLLSLPAMMRAGYDPKLACGVICAAGTLGQIVPPSTVLIFLADILQSANSAAQMQRGNFAPDTVSVGDLFAGAFIPGIALAFLYGLWVAIRAMLDPKAAPALVMSRAEKAGLGRRIVIALIPPLALIVAVLGSIISGVATPTESASVGSVGAIFLCLMKLLGDHLLRNRDQVLQERAMAGFWIGFLLFAVGLGWLTGPFGLLTFLLVAVVLALLPALSIPALRRSFVDVLVATNRSTLSISSMVFIILLGATAFALVFTRMGGDMLVQDLLRAMPGGDLGALIVVMAIMFVLGFFLDTFEIVFIVVPITAPILLLMGIDPILLGVLIGINLQTSFLTPALRLLPLLPARRGAEGDHDGDDLQGHRALRGDPACGPVGGLHAAPVGHLAAERAVPIQQRDHGRPAAGRRPERTGGGRRDGRAEQLTPARPAHCLHCPPPRAGPTGGGPPASGAGMDLPQRRRGCTKWRSPSGRTPNAEGRRGPAARPPRSSGGDRRPADVQRPRVQEGLLVEAQEAHRVLAGAQVALHHAAHVGVVAVQHLVDHFARRVAEAGEHVVVQAQEAHAVLGAQHLHGAARAEVVLDLHVLMLLAGGNADDGLHVTGQAVPTAAVDHQLHHAARLLHAGAIGDLGNLVEAERQVVQRPDELARVDRAGLECREDLAAWQQHGGAAHAVDQVAAEARDAHLQAAEVGHRVDLPLEPAEGLGGRLAGREGDDAELGIQLVPELPAAAKAHPRHLLLRRHAEGHREEDGEGCALAMVVEGGVVAHVGRAVHHRIHAAQRRNQFASGEDADAHAAARHLLDVGS